jgi:hypothetical protein
MLLRDLAAQDAHVATPACDITNKSLLEAVLCNCALTMPPVKGCIQASMVLKVSLSLGILLTLDSGNVGVVANYPFCQDSTFENMSFDDWRAATRPKVQGSWNLNELLPNGMDFFIMLSSMAGIFGSRGQSNYAAGNTFQDELARHRIGLGEKAIALDLGFFSSVGIMAEKEELKERFSSYSAFRPVTELELHALLDYYCDPNLDLLTSLKCQTVVGVGVPEGQVERSLDAAYYWLRMPSFRHLVQVDGTGDAAASKPQQIVDFSSLFASASSLAEASAFVTEALIKKLSKMLSIAQEELDVNKPMHLYGVDSLVAVELRNWFATELHVDVAIFDILGAATTATVGRLAAEKSSYRQAGWVN